ncbi:MAG: KEOPS complex subunit Pcc1 [Candidatus Altiarchaeia archaeon]
MKYVARLTTESKDASSVSRALNVDNIKLEGLVVESGVVDNKIITNIESNNLKTLINTLDDLISCQMAAEKLLDD